MKTAKQEAIEKAYTKIGMDWAEISQYVDENTGVLILPSPNLKTQLKGYDSLILDKDRWVAFDKLGLKLLPSSLKGIYNNNGWIRIESEDDLPKGEGQYFVYSNDGFPRIDIFTRRLTNAIHHTTGKPIFSHYQPIQKPDLPIY